MDTERLIWEAQEGDDFALQDLYTRYYPRVARIVRMRLGPRLRVVVEVDDIIQETFLRAVLQLQDFSVQSEAGFLDWLATIALNQIRAAAKHWSREKRSPDREERHSIHPRDSLSERVLQISARVTGPLTGAARSEREQILEAALDELDEVHREVIILRSLVGASFEEIAARLGRPSEAAARELFRRARARLAVKLRGRGLGQEDALGT